MDPRVLINASNANAIVIHGETPETRIHFYNSDGAHFSLDASNQQFALRYQDSNTLALFDGDRVQFSNIHATSLRFIGCNISDKLVVLHQDEPLLEKFFDGFGYDGTGASYNSRRHLFTVPANSLATAPVAAFTQSTNAAQLALGANAIVNIASNESLRVDGDTYLAGDLMVTGEIKYNNINVPKYDSNTNRFAASQLPTSIVYTDPNTSKIDASILPTDYTFQYLRGNKNVGIGTRTPAQKFHVQGSAVFSDRVGINTTQPAARLHINDTVGTTPLVYINTVSGGAPILTAKVNSQVALAIAGTHTGVGVGTDLVPLSSTFHIKGDMTVAGSMTGGAVTFERFGISSNNISLMTQERLIGREWLRARMPVEFNAPITVDELSTTSSNYIRFRSDIVADGDVLIYGNLYNLSDARVKTDIAPIKNALDKVSKLGGYTYTRNGREHVGVLAQEVAEVLPQAVKETDNGEMVVCYDALIPLIIQAIREMNYPQ